MKDIQNLHFESKLQISPYYVDGKSSICPLVFVHVDLFPKTVQM